MSTFGSTKRSLPHILSDIVKGKTLLPDFQRGWVWDDEHIRTLLLSIARSLPGVAMTLWETGLETRILLQAVMRVELPAGSLRLGRKVSIRLQFGLGRRCANNIGG